MDKVWQHNFIEDAWQHSDFQKATGLVPVPELYDYKLNHIASLEHLRIHQWNDQFITLMRNRLLFGAYRYGEFAKQDIYATDVVNSAIERLKAYQKPEGGNAEHLVDAANCCLVEFNHQRHPKFHFEATDDQLHCWWKESKNENIVNGNSR